MMILFVEDDQSLAELVIEYLEIEGIECDHTFNGLNAIELSQKNTYDAFVLDINLPGCDGLQVCESLRENGISTPCIMLTARNTLDDKLTAFRVGTNDYLVKPFAMAELVARLHALTQSQQHAKTLKIADMELHLEERYALRSGNRIQPGPEDWRTLVYLARKSPKVVNRVELEDYLWPEGAPSSDALKMVIYRLRKAIDKKGAEPLLQTIRGVGVALRSQA
ncbi:MAG: response regulator transcription factor [Pseudomonadales bacterium]|nr:response regulator transcription factor [Pseudomonadales bacterium]